VRKQAVWSLSVTYQSTVDGRCENDGAKKVDRLWTVVVHNLTAHIGSGDVDLIVEQRQTMQQVGLQVSAVVECIASIHADDVGPIVEERGLSKMVVMEGKEQALQVKKVVEQNRMQFPE